MLIDGMLWLVESKSRKYENIEMNVSFAQRNEQQNASIKMVAFHLAWQRDYTRFGIACPLLVLSNGGL